METAINCLPAAGLTAGLVEVYASALVTIKLNPLDKLTCSWVLAFTVCSLIELVVSTLVLRSSWPSSRGTTSALASGVLVGGGVVPVLVVGLLSSWFIT